MFSYLNYVLAAVAALLVTCHAKCKCPGIPGVPGNSRLSGITGLREQQRLWGLPYSLDPEVYNELEDLKYRVSRLENVLALTGKIRVIGEKILASSGKNVDFASAVQSCEEAGGTLAAPRNKEENEAVLGIVKEYNQYAYLGIKEGETAGQFLYLTGTPLNYTNWHQYEPNGKGTEKCVEMYTDGSWNDKNCKEYRLPVCEF